MSRVRFSFATTTATAPSARFLDSGDLFYWLTVSFPSLSSRFRRPLAPNTCASVRMRFLAVRPGVHTLDELRLVDLATGRETKLKKPLAIVVEA